MDTTDLPKPVSFRTEPGPSVLTDSTKSPQDIIKALSDANADMARRLGIAVIQLKKDRDQFVFYTEAHRQKQTPEADEKARVNAEFSSDIDKLLEELIPSD